MEAIAVIGVDLATSVFQVHGVDARGLVVVSKRLSRAKLLHNALGSLLCRHCRHELPVRFRPFTERS